MKTLISTIGIIIIVAGCGGADLKGTAGFKKGDDKNQLGRIDTNNRCETGKNREVIVDLNQDNIADVRKLYATINDEEIMICREADLNFDGMKDIFVYFDENGLIKRDEIDLDYDGKIDIVSIYANGKVVKQELDTNSDGNIDRLRFLKDGVPTRMEGDTDQDGHIDYWEYYKGGKLIRTGMDMDGDGTPDGWNRDEPIEEEEAEEESEEESEEDTDKEDGDE